MIDYLTSNILNSERKSFTILPREMETNASSDIKELERKLADIEKIEEASKPSSSKLQSSVRRLSQARRVSKVLTAAVGGGGGS